MLDDNGRRLIKVGGDVHRGVCIEDVVEGKFLAVKFLEWVNTRQIIADFNDLERFKTLWDVPDIILPRHVFVSGFDTACKLLSNDSSIVRIADQSTKNIPVKWANVPKGVSS